MKLLLVGGCQRSGTSLAQTILCSSPLSNPMIKEAEHLRRFIESYQYGKVIFDQKTCDYFKDKDEFMAIYVSFVQQYMRKIGHNIGSYQWYILKDPLFSKLCVEIKELLPQSCFLCLVRDPRDTIASLLEVNRKWKEKNKTVIFPRDMNYLCNLYLSYYNTIPADYRQQWEGRLQLIKYEDMVMHPDQFISQVNSIFGLEINIERIKEGADKGSFQYSPAYNSDLLGKAISIEPIGKYKQILTNEEIQIIQNNLNNFFVSFNYDKE